MIDTEDVVALPELRGMRVGYVPYAPDLSNPSDRRRFCSWAKSRNVKFEIANPKDSYDLVIVTPGGDITRWAEYAGPAKIIYDQIDSYLAVRATDPKSLLRGLGKFVAGQTSRLRLSYWKAIADMCRRADAVICTTDEQRSDILGYCNNVRIILDVQDELLRIIKTSYAAGPIFNLVWEGLPENVETFSEIRSVLRELQRSHKLALHLVTDPDWKPHLKRYGHRHTIDIARNLFEPVYLYSWNQQMSATIMTNCDLAVIPIPPVAPLAVGKPENKLLLFWRLGIPAIVSATPAYARAMERAGLSMACSGEKEWSMALEHYIADGDARKVAAEAGLRTANGDFYSAPATLAKWDTAVCSVL